MPPITFLLALLAQDPAGPPPADEQRVVTNPEWLERPSGADLGRFFPRPALSAGISARAVISCRVTDAGTLDACEVTDEDPPGHGFGEATLRLADRFRMTPGHGGARVNIPVTWNAPPPDPSGAPVLDLDELTYCAGLAVARSEHAPSEAHTREALMLASVHQQIMGQMDDAEAWRERLISARDATAARFRAGDPPTPCEVEAGPAGFAVHAPDDMAY